MTAALSLPPLATASTFWVTVQKTEAAERCGLQGTYVLKASCDRLVLGDPHSKQPLYTWPYRLLRRYGRDKVGVGLGQHRLLQAGGGSDWLTERPPSAPQGPRCGRPGGGGSWHGPRKALGQL